MIGKIQSSVVKPLLRNGCHRIVRPRLMGMDLRDAIQTRNPAVFTTPIKMEMLEKIWMEMLPKIWRAHVDIATWEVGAIVNPKVLPIMSDSLEMLYFANEHAPSWSQHYLLVPNLAQLETIEHAVISGAARRFSFITSASENFQQKNTRRGLADTRADIDQMIKRLNYWTANTPNPVRDTTKLYISCINECPLAGIISDSNIMKQILPYTRYVDSGELGQICLADTCGTLSPNKFVHLADTLHDIGGVSYDKIGLHLHVNMTDKDRKREVRNILNAAFDRGMIHFDVNYLEESEGGCSVTMRGSERPMYPNLTYNYFMKCWADWATNIVENMNKTGQGV